MKNLITWATANPLPATLIGLTVIAVLVALFGTETAGGWIEAVWQSNQGD